MKVESACIVGVKVRRLDQAPFDISLPDIRLVKADLGSRTTFLKHRSSTSYSKSGRKFGFASGGDKSRVVDTVDFEDNEIVQSARCSGSFLDQFLVWRQTIELDVQSYEFDPYDNGFHADAQREMDRICPELPGSFIEFAGRASKDDPWLVFLCITAKDPSLDRGDARSFPMGPCSYQGHEPQLFGDYLAFENWENWLTEPLVLLRSICEGDENRPWSPTGIRRQFDLDPLFDFYVVERIAHSIFVSLDAILHRIHSEPFEGRKIPRRRDVSNYLTIWQRDKIRLRSLKRQYLAVCGETKRSIGRVEEVVDYEFRYQFSNQAHENSLRMLTPIIDGDIRRFRELCVKIDRKFLDCDAGVGDYDAYLTNSLNISIGNASLKWAKFAVLVSCAAAVFSIYQMKSVQLFFGNFLRKLLAFTGN